MKCQTDKCGICGDDLSYMKEWFRKSIIEVSFSQPKSQNSLFSTIKGHRILESYKERDKIRHIIHCQFEKIPTRNGRPLYLTDESKSRKTCLCCGDDYSNILPTGFYLTNYSSKIFVDYTSLRDAIETRDPRTKQTVRCTRYWGQILTVKMYGSVRGLPWCSVILETFQSPRWKFFLRIF